MNSYITFDGYRYKATHQNWSPAAEHKPSTVRPTLLGGLDATYGPVTILEWRGEIEAPIVASAPWGTIANLRTSLRKRAGLSFTDHYGQTYTVHAVGPFGERSLSPKWDSPSNKIYKSVTLYYQEA